MGARITQVQRKWPITLKIWHALEEKHMKPLLVLRAISVTNPNAVPVMGHYAAKKKTHEHIPTFAGRHCPAASRPFVL